MSEYPESGTESRAPDDSALEARSESAESAEDGPTDLASAARLLGADVGATIGDTADSDVAELGEPASAEDAEQSAEVAAVAEVAAEELVEEAVEDAIVESCRGGVEDAVEARSRG